MGRGPAPAGGPGRLDGKPAMTWLDEDSLSVARAMRKPASEHSTRVVDEINLRKKGGNDVLQSAID